MTKINSFFLTFIRYALPSHTHTLGKWIWVLSYSLYVSNGYRIRCDLFWCICNYLYLISYAFSLLNTKWFVYWFPCLILFCRSPCLPFPFGASILQAYVHLGYLLMSDTLFMPFLPYFVCIDWMDCFLSSFSCGLLAPIFLMWHSHFWTGNLDG